MNEPAVIAHSAVKFCSRTPASGSGAPHGTTTLASEALAVEEPLEIRLGGRHFTLTMRTPGHDHELVAGFLLTEGFIASRKELGEIRAVRDARGNPEPNIVDVILDVPVAALRERLRRNFIISSSCGVCGKTSIEAIQRRVATLKDSLRIDATSLLAMPRLMRATQDVFQVTGGLHAAALFRPPKCAVDSSPQLIALREDVGRHNAVDKLLGYALMHELLPLTDCVLMVSGRLSFELVQKAAVAGVAIVAAVSAPSSLAVSLAEEVGMTLAGFVRDGSFNVYTHAERIVV
jgi:FdhD protein